MESQKFENSGSAGIIKRMEQLVAKISAALAQSKKPHVAELSKAMGDFESRVERILERTEELDKIQVILNDKYYFPNIDSIICYVQQTFSKKLPYKKNRRAVAWDAAKVIDTEGGVDRLKQDVSSFQRAPSKKEAPVVDLYALSLEEIQQELSDVSKYPDIIALKKILRGLLPSKKLSDLHSREGLIQATIRAIERKRGVSVFSRGSRKDTGGYNDNRP